MRLKASTLFIAISLLPAYFVVFLLVYWGIYDSKPVLTVQYEHPLMLYWPAHSRQEAQAHEIRAVTGGTEVYKYEEICVNSNKPGVISRWWSNHFVVALPDRTEMLEQGCYTRSIAQSTPKVTERTNYTFHKYVTYQNNPIVRTVTRFTPIFITLLPAAEQD